MSSEPAGRSSEVAFSGRHGERGLERARSCLPLTHCVVDLGGSPEPRADARHDWGGGGSRAGWLIWPRVSADSAAARRREAPVLGEEDKQAQTRVRGLDAAREEPGRAQGSAADADARSPSAGQRRRPMRRALGGRDMLCQNVTEG
jgi:hypothetical protein